MVKEFRKSSEEKVSPSATQLTGKKIHKLKIQNEQGER